MKNRQAYADSFRQLVANVERLREKVNDDVHKFQQNVEHYEEFSFPQRIKLGNQLRGLLEKPGKRYITPKDKNFGESPEGRANQRADIEELLTNPHQAANLRASQLGSDLARQVDEEAGVLIIEAFKDECILSPIRLFRELKTYLAQCPTSPSGIWTWPKIVIPCLREEEKYAARFVAISDDPLAPVKNQVTACEIIADQLDSAATDGRKQKTPEFSVPTRRDSTTKTSTEAQAGEVGDAVQNKPDEPLRRGAPRPAAMAPVAGPAANLIDPRVEESTPAPTSFVKAPGKKNKTPPRGCERHILLAMYKLKAFDIESLQATCNIAKEAQGYSAMPDSYKQPMVALKKSGYVETRPGRNGGCWLTPTGRALAKSLKKP